MEKSHAVVATCLCVGIAVALYSFTRMIEVSSDPNMTERNSEDSSNCSHGTELRIQANIVSESVGVQDDVSVQDSTESTDLVGTDAQSGAPSGNHSSHMESVQIPDSELESSASNDDVEDGTTWIQEMIQAARYGDTMSMQRFIDQGVGASGSSDNITETTEPAAGTLVNTRRSDDGATPLLLASQNGHVEAVKLLLAHGAKPSLAANSGEHPLLLAANQGHLQVVEILLEARTLGSPTDMIDQTDDDGATALLLACQNGHHKVVELLVASGADDSVSMTDGGRTPLLLASQGGHAAVIECLLHNATHSHARTKAPGADGGGGGDDGGEDDDESEALDKSTESAARGSGASRVHAFVNTAGDDGLTPLFAAAHQGHTAVVVRLLEAGADPTSSNYLGFTPESIAKAMGHSRCARILKDALE